MPSSSIRHAHYSTLRHTYVRTLRIADIIATLFSRSHEMLRRCYIVRQHASSVHLRPFSIHRAVVIASVSKILSTVKRAWSPAGHEVVMSQSCSPVQRNRWGGKKGVDDAHRHRRVSKVFQYSRAMFATCARTIVQENDM